MPPPLQKDTPQNQGSSTPAKKRSVLELCSPITPLNKFRSGGYRNKPLALNDSPSSETLGDASTTTESTPVSDVTPALVSSVSDFSSSSTAQQRASAKSTSETASYHSPIEMSGWVFKSKSRMPTKIRRYFRLNGSFLYNHPSLTEPPTWRVSLSHSMVHFHQERNMILLNLPNRLLRFNLATPEEGNRWYIALRSAIVCNINDFYNLGRIIGDGSFASVREGKCLVTGATRAVKTIHRSSNAKEREFVQREMTALLSIAHINIVRCFDVFDERHCIHVVMTFHPEGDLFTYLSGRPHFGRQNARNALWQVMQGVKYLHDRGIAHRDIKLENVLVAGEEPLHLQLTDFGFANFVSDKAGAPGREFVSVVGTAHYMAPEVIDGSGHGLPVDIFAAGVLLYRLVTGRLPFRALTPRESFLLAAEERADFGGKEWGAVSEAARELCRWMMKASAKDRPSAQEVVQHEWFGEDRFAQMAMDQEGELRKARAAAEEQERAAWAHWERQWERRMEINKQAGGVGSAEAGGL